VKWQKKSPGVPGLCIAFLNAQRYITRNFQGDYYYDGWWKCGSLWAHQIVKSDLIFTEFPDLCNDFCWLRQPGLASTSRASNHHAPALAGTPLQISGCFSDLTENYSPIVFLQILIKYKQYDRKLKNHGEYVIFKRFGK
jgi:hypothetical protein